VELAEKRFERWCDGQTGFPLVDAGMRQLKREGWMHNRARLVVGSFLTKDLGIDWRLGERHFMRYLIDGDEANNNGNWQWIASVGTDPQPAFLRIYNQALHIKRYDPNGDYVRRYVPELEPVPDKYLAEPWEMPPRGAAGVSRGHRRGLPGADGRKEEGARRGARALPGVRAYTRREVAEADVLEIQMPAMGESVTEGTILEWHVAEGEEVSEGDTIVEVSTDKIDAEVPAPASGVITKIMAQPDDTVTVGQVLA